MIRATEIALPAERSNQIRDRRASSVEQLCRSRDPTPMRNVRYRGWWACGAMGVRMDFALLGPLLVRRGQTIVPVPTGKQRVLLAVLLGFFRCSEIGMLVMSRGGRRDRPSADAPARS